MRIIINNSSMIPIYEQLSDQIKTLIRNGELKESDNLPSVRTLSKDQRPYRKEGLRQPGGRWVYRHRSRKGNLCGRSEPAAAVGRTEEGSGVGFGEGCPEGQSLWYQRRGYQEPV